jgi:Spy/CpxP family protein refolding chaperone
LPLVTVANPDRQFTQTRNPENKADNNMETGLLPRKLFAQALGLLIICIGASSPALGQDNTSNAQPSVSPGNSAPQGPGPAKQGRANPEKMKQRQLARLQKIVQLTPDQQTKVTPIISNFVDQLVAVRNDSSLQPDAKKAKQKELRKEYSQQIRSLLTPQQKQALRNARAGQKQGKGQNQNQNGNQDEDQKFEHGSNQPGSDI